MKITASLYWISDKDHKYGGRYEVLSGSHMDGHSSYGSTWRLLDTKEIEFDPIAFDARGELIESMKKEKKELIREATKKAEQIEEKIQQLLALDAPVSA